MIPCNFSNSIHSRKKGFSIIVWVFYIWLNMILKINMIFKWIWGGGFKPEGEKEKREKKNITRTMAISHAPSTNCAWLSIAVYRLDNRQRWQAHLEMRVCELVEFYFNCGLYYKDIIGPILVWSDICLLIMQSNKVDLRALNELQPNKFLIARKVNVVWLQI